MRMLLSLLLLFLLGCSDSESNGALGSTDPTGTDARDGADNTDMTTDTDGLDATDNLDGADQTDAIDGADTQDGAESVDSTDGIDVTDGTTGQDAVDGSGAVTVLDYGTIEATGGSSSTLTFTASETAVSFSVTVEGEPGVFYAVDNLRAPDGTVIVPGTWPSNIGNQGGHIVCLICDNRISSGESAHGVLVPNAPDVPMQAGTWSFNVMSFSVSNGGNPFGAPTIELEDSTYDLRVSVLEPADGVLPTAGRLGLNLWFTGSDGLTAETAQTDARIQEAVTKFVETYAAIGVAVGPVRYQDIDIGIDTVDSISGAGNDFEALASATDGAEPGVNLIFVAEIVDGSSPLGGFGLILGIAGGIPGPTLGQGTGRSAVLIRTAEIPDGAGLPVPADLGNTMAHEAGHYLGLFHSSEQALFGPQLHDPLPDTAENDEQNLMHYNNLGNTISVEQGNVIRRNPWVQPEVQ